MFPIFSDCSSQKLWTAMLPSRTMRVVGELGKWAHFGDRFTFINKALLKIIKSMAFRQETKRLKSFLLTLRLLCKPIIEVGKMVDIWATKDENLPTMIKTQLIMRIKADTAAIEMLYVDDHLDKSTEKKATTLEESSLQTSLSRCTRCSCEELLDFSIMPPSISEAFTPSHTSPSSTSSSRQSSVTWSSVVELSISSSLKPSELSLPICKNNRGLSMTMHWLLIRQDLLRA